MRQAMRAVLFVMAGAATVMVWDRLAGASHGAAAPTAGLQLCATPRGQLSVAGSGGCGAGTTSAGVVAHQQSADDAFTHIAALESRLAALEADNASLESRVSNLEGTLAGVTRTGSVLTFSGVNLQVVNGTNSTETSNGTGNLIIGYNAQPEPSPARNGSHYLVVGDGHEWTRWGGIVAGFHNTASGDWASVTGGRRNTASGDWASVSGGSFNTASESSSSVSGGHLNFASGIRSSVSGGQFNFAAGPHSSVSGGAGRSAPGTDNWAAGGLFEHS